MAKTYIIVEKSQIRSQSIGGGWWFVLQGKFDEMAPLMMVEHEADLTLQDSSIQRVSIMDATMRNGVLSVKLDPVDGNALDGSKVARQASLTVF